ncbi:NAD-dependent epimerase/dehydratase family protein [Flavobacterium branchiophilum]|uniref:NAD(P)-dependent oxidoreductase n=1 Tax=Flavobacterium branchiophilum TaxID=55197 RepID=A0A2H3KXQ6_9FLAO|nr:NAD-dependent epimerase/dehydratase family protein [Flavobacterium branchiophilum]PDS24246.1 NAD(P)-dependent oxidoreductase [Flavobacterium branchiophilum]
MSKKIAVLGCGWLGFPLCKAFIKQGFEVNGTTTTASKVTELKEAGIVPFCISLDSEGVRGDIAAFLEGVSVLVINIPPQLRKANSRGTEQVFVQKIQNLLPYIEHSGVSKVLFVSSTSVYADSTMIITEQTPPNPITESGQQLAIVEDLLQSNGAFETTIVRFGGLVGPKRHPVWSLSGQQNIANPEAPILLIHQKNAIEILMQIVIKNVWNTLFNAVAPYHPSKKMFYQSLAQKWHLPMPEFDDQSVSKLKYIANYRLSKVLHYHFDHHHLDDLEF